MTEIQNESRTDCFHIKFFSGQPVDGDILYAMQCNSTVSFLGNELSIKYLYSVSVFFQEYKCSLFWLFIAGIERKELPHMTADQILGEMVC